MTDEAKRCVEALRWSHLHDDCSDNAYICPVAHECARSYRNLCDPAIAADLIVSLSEKNEQLEYALVGVMHFVDKWLDDIEPYCSIDDPSGQIAIDRAAEARRITLKHIEDLTREMYRRGQELSEVQRERNAAVEELKEYLTCHGCVNDDFCKKDYPMCDGCALEKCPCHSCTGLSNWQWCGVKEEESKENSK